MQNRDWFKKSVVYQIYPKSFCDKNGDGIGDIQGIISKLDYLKELGIEVIWLTPIYKSPQKDNGYDISDYYNIDSIFGTMQEFENLLEKIHIRKMKLVMDMVINHTSIEHMWFKEALKGKDNKYHNYYIWRDKPNNWKSKFGGSAWKYVENLDKYYLHLFDVSQADLNWENKNLRLDIYKMINYWLKKGVDGFRLDVINLLSKDMKFPDDTLATATDDGRKFYTDGEKIHEYLNELNKNTFNKYKGCMTVGEMSSTTLEHCIKYSNPKNNEINMTFSFHHLKVDYPNGEKWALAKPDFINLKKILFDWQVGMQEGGGWNAMFWSNHDQPRAVSRFGSEEFIDKSAKMLASVIHFMRGTPYIYQGEEFAMTNPNFKNIDMYKDVESKNAYNNLLEKGMSKEKAMKILAQKSRDNSRTPMQWNEKGGFSKAKPWIDMASNLKKINAQNSVEDKNSVFYFYQKLIKLRKNLDIISHGTITPILKDDKNILAYLREYKEQKLLVVHNFFENETTFNVPEQYLKGDIILSNYNDVEVKKNIKLRSYEMFAIFIK